MKAAVVREGGKAPVYSEFDDPIPSVEEVLVRVTASALTNFTKVRAAGKHFSFRAQPPFIVGIDGVGRLDDGRRRRVYFVFPKAPWGGMAQQTVVPLSQCVEVPYDFKNVDDVTLAAIADPGMSAWVALEMRAKLVPGETVLVNGATGTAGTTAVQIAKHLGAKKVIATGRNRQTLNGLLSVGADEIVVLGDDSNPADAAFREHFERGVDIVLDYLWGSSAEQILAAATVQKSMKPIRFIQVGTASEANITLPGTLLRASTLQIMGSGIGNVPLDGILGVLSKLMQAAPKIGFRIATEVLPMHRIEDAWSVESHTPRVIFTVEQ